MNGTMVMIAFPDGSEARGLVIDTIAGATEEAMPHVNAVHLSRSGVKTQLGIATEVALRVPHESAPESDSEGRPRPVWKVL